MEKRKIKICITCKIGFLTKRSKYCINCQKERTKLSNQRYRQTQQGKENRKKWKAAHYQRYKERLKEKQKLHDRQTEIKIRKWAYNKRWVHSKEGNEWIKNYEKTSKRKNIKKKASIKFRKSPKGKVNTKILNKNRTCKLKQVIGSFSPKEWLKIRNSSPICSMCGRFVECENLTIDHIIPIKRGGTNYIWNIQALCSSCNSKKNDRLPSVIYL